MLHIKNYCIVCEKGSPDTRRSCAIRVCRSGLDHLALVWCLCVVLHCFALPFQCLSEWHRITGISDVIMMHNKELTLHALSRYDL